MAGPRSPLAPTPPPAGPKTVAMAVLGGERLCRLPFVLAAKRTPLVGSAASPEQASCALVTE